MAFIREDLEELKRAAAAPRREVMPSGAGAGLRASVSRGGPRMAPGGGTSGAGGPLLVDYLRANAGAQPLGQVQKELQQQAGRLEAQEYKGTAKGLKTAEAAKAEERTLRPIQQPGQAMATAEASPGLQQFLEAQKPQAAFESAEAAAKAALELEATAGQLGTEAGRQAVLQEKYGKGQTYTAGEAALDAALAGATSGQQLSGLAKKYGQLYETVTGKQKTAEEKFTAETQKTAAERERVAADQAAAAAIRASAAERAKANYDMQQRKKAAQERASVRYSTGKNALEWAKKNNAINAYMQFAAGLHAQALADEDYQNLVLKGKADDPFYFYKTYEDFLADEYAAAGLNRDEAYGRGGT